MKRDACTLVTSAGRIGLRLLSTPFDATSLLLVVVPLCLLVCLRGDGAEAASVASIARSSERRRGIHKAVGIGKRPRRAVCAILQPLHRAVPIKRGEVLPA